MAEILIVMALSIIVVGGPLTFITLSLKQQDLAASRATAVRQAETGLQRLTRDLRQVVQGTTISFTWSGSSASATFTIPQGTQGASTQSVTWSCTFGNSGTCTRQTTSGTQTEISNVLGLTFSPFDANGNALSSPASGTNLSYVDLKLSVLDVSQLDSSSSPSHQVPGVSNPIVVQDGVDLRGNSAL